MTGDAVPDGRITVLYSNLFDGWELPPFDGLALSLSSHGGERALLELAAGMASNGLNVELRGRHREADVAQIEDATGVRLGRPTERRKLDASDVVIMPEGHRDPRLFARVALSPARAVLFIQGALGLFGWSFDDRPGPTGDELLTFDISSVGRPEQLMAARECGFELWTNLAATAQQGGDIGLPIHYIGSGRPIPYPEPVTKQIDVLILGENRWSPLARRALTELPQNIKTLVLPRVGHAEVLAAFSLTRIVFHPARIEGRSRIAEEVRAMRAVPVLLSSNSLGEGYGDEYGSVVIDSVGEMATAAVSLLEQPERLERLADNGYRWAREIGDWDAYQRRLLKALATPDEDVRVGAPVRAQRGHQLAALEIS